MSALSDGTLSMELAGEPVLLLGDRALYWPACRRLIIADLHLGKEHVFRQAGIAVPRGATEADLRRLTHLIVTTEAHELWIVGDMLHGPGSQAQWRDSWMHWRQSHEKVHVVALTGNHDRALDGDALGIQQLGQEYADGPFLFRHVPQIDPQGRHVIAGHVHPQARVPGVPRHWPVFWIQSAMTVLPAFSSFTGGQRLDVKCDDVLIACVEGSVIAI